MMNNLQVKDAINSNRHSPSHDDKSHSSYPSQKDRSSSESLNPHPSEPIPSESADQTSLPEGAPVQSAPPQFSPSVPQSTLPALYSIPRYQFYPYNFVFPSNFQPAVGTVSLFPSFHVDRRRRSRVGRFSRFFQRAQRDDARFRSSPCLISSFPGSTCTT